VEERHPDLRPPDERTALEQRLDHHRGLVVAALTGLDHAQASRRALPATDLTILGIVKHLAWTEDRWFQHKFLGHDLPEAWAAAPPGESDWPFTSSAPDTVDDVIALYRDACARSRCAAAGQALDTPAALVSFGRGPVNLRWLLVHMIDETARHLGHIDLLRDALAADGCEAP